MRTGGIKITCTNILILLVLNFSASSQPPSSKERKLFTNEDYPFIDRTGFIQITNRLDPDNWKMQGKAFWAVENEEIVGRQDPNENEDSWLFSSTEWSDFVLELEFFVPEKCNSGIGIRMPKDSTGSPDVYGYEVQISDIPKRKLTGSLLHHANQCNQLAIICEGEHIRVYLNRQKILDEIVKGSLKGRIGLQVPKDPKFAIQVVRFRNLLVKELN